MPAENSPSTQESSEASQLESDTLANNQSAAEQSTHQDTFDQTATLPAAPALNREQRRAQAKGKKTGATGGNPALGQFNNHPNTNTRAGAPVQNRLPRTGHK